MFVFGLLKAVQAAEMPALFGLPEGTELNVCNFDVDDMIGVEIEAGTEYFTQNGKAIAEEKMVLYSVDPFEAEFIDENNIVKWGYPFFYFAIPKRTSVTITPRDIILKLSFSHAKWLFSNWDILPTD